MRRFEFVEGSSSKFWEIEVDDSSLTVRYGRIGTSGQTQTKSFASAAKAQAEHDKLVREKTAKGYAEVGVAAGAALAAVAPKPPPPSPAAPAVAVAAAAAVPTPAPTAAVAVAVAVAAAAAAAAPVSQVSTASAFAAEPQPPGAFLWTPAWRRKLASLRGLEPAPPALDAQACLRELATEWTRVRSKLQPLLLRVARKLDVEAAAALQAADFAPLGELLAAVPAREDVWAAALLASAGYVQAHSYRDPAYKPQLLWRALVALHGLGCAVGHAFRLTRATVDEPYRSWWLLEQSGLRALRDRLAAAPEGDYQAALADARAEAGRDALSACLAAYLFATEHELIEGALAAPRRTPHDGYFLLDCALTPAQAQRLHDDLAAQPWLYADALEVGVLNLARLALPAALARTLAWAAREQTSTDERRRAFEIVRAHDSVQALAELLARIDVKEARPQLEAFAQQWPQLSIRLAAERIVASGDKALREWLTRFAAAHREALDAARAGATDAIRPLLDALAARQQAQPPDAPLAALPEWLRAPPWRERRRAAAPEFPRMVPHEVVAHMAWKDGERARWQGTHAPQTVRFGDWHIEMRGKQGEPLARQALGLLGVRNEAHAKALAGERLGSDDLAVERWAYPLYLMALPPTTACQVLAAKDPRHWSEWNEPKLEAIVAWLDGVGAPALETFAERHVERGLQLALPLASARIASLAATALRNSKRAKAPAQAWQLRHAHLAADALLPQLADRARGEDASHALRWLLANGREAAVAAAAEGYGADGRVALRALRAHDPMQLAPLKIPKLPPFWAAAGCARPLLRAGGALPLAVMDAVAEMLAFSTADAPYAGIDRLRELCTPQSLGAFAWDLFQGWLGAGAPSKESWAFTAMAHLGDDECARRLALLIRAWPGEAAHARAIVGLDVLAAIGSDVALMHLNGIAQKVKFKGLQEKARAKIDQLALARGLTAEELADRLVPDLGLDEAGTMLLDFGPRQFTVGFDEALKPYARDASGAPLKDLPKPNKSDEAALAEDAHERWKALRKDARTLASQQILRLELAMAQRRRWSAVEFRRFFVEHPLVRHLARRLLWAEFVDDRPARCLRVAEDLSYADAKDDTLTLADDAQVGLVHALELSPADAAVFGQIFADYEILQPFAQLGREVFPLAEDERAAFELLRFKDRQVATGSVFGLENRGWRRGQPQDAGWIGWFSRRVGEDLEVQLDLDPGTVVGEINYEPKQKLGPLVLRRPDTWGEAGRRRWGELDPVLASEVLRDVSRLAEVA